MDFGDAMSMHPKELGHPTRGHPSVDGDAVRAGSWNRRTKLEWMYTGANGMDGPALAQWFLRWLVRGIVQAFVHSTGWRLLLDRAGGLRRPWRSIVISAIAYHRRAAEDPCLVVALLQGSAEALDTR